MQINQFEHNEIKILKGYDNCFTQDRINVNELSKFLKELKTFDHKIPDDTIRKIFYNIIELNEENRKLNVLKKIVVNFISYIANVSNGINLVYCCAHDLPIMINSKWDFLAILNDRGLIDDFDKDVLLDELRACSSMQDCASRCSPFVISLATRESTAEKCAQLIYSCLKSPSSATRSNVNRAWLHRLVSHSEAKFCVRRIIELARDEILNHHDEPIWPIPMRQLRTVTCVDLEWNPVLSDDYYMENHLALYAYFNVYIGLSLRASKISLKDELQENGTGKSILYIGLHFHDLSVRLLAYKVSAIYKTHLKYLENQIIIDIEKDIDTIFREGVIDEGLLEHFTGEVQSLLRRRLEEWKIQNKELSRFYPAVEADIVRESVDLTSFVTLNESLNRLLAIQSVLDYPSVADVMDSLKVRNVDERYFVEQCIKLMDSAVDMNSRRIITDKECAGFLFKVISKCPLRSVVDYGGEQMSKLNKSVEFRDTIFEKAINLLDTNKENTRALTFQVCFNSTVQNDSERFKTIWNICKQFRNDVKQRKMFEMLADVISSTKTLVDFGDLNEMFLTSLGLIKEYSKNCSTQLFQSVVSKILSLSHEVDRLCLFTALHSNSNIYKMINQVLSYKPRDFSKKAFHLCLHFFSRFHFVSYEFYSFEELKMIAMIQKFITFVIKCYQEDQIMLSAAVDAMCGYMEWKNIRNYAYIDENDNNGLEKIVSENLRHYHYWYILKKSIELPRTCTKKDIEELPNSAWIVDYIDKELDDAVDNFVKLENDEKRTKESYWLCFSILCDRASNQRHLHSKLMGLTYKFNFDNDDDEISMIALEWMWRGKDRLKL